ncbi:hypothetical protein FRC20_007387 [Serendipita sp. 405]|nr:hypothetical protein FRC20_007387 [Serendipita sp. 405]
MFTQTRPPFNPENARIILLDPPGKDMAEYLSRAPRLTALKGTLSIICGTNELQAQSLFDRLTHLTLTRLSPREMKSAYQFPRLRFLQVVLDWAVDIQLRHSYVPLWRWGLPKLVSLVVRGDVHDLYREDLLKFFQSHSSTIECLVLTYKQFASPGRRGPSFEGYTNPFRQFLPLKTMGIKIKIQDLDLFSRGPSLEGGKRPHAMAPIHDLLLLGRCFFAG